MAMSSESSPSRSYTGAYNHARIYTATESLLLNITGFFVPSPNGPNIQATFDATGHARQRCLLSHAFSEIALREQKSIVQSYVDMLVEKLHQEVASHRETVDISRWLTYMNFDILGDLAFGESFDCLRNSDYHLWLMILFDSVRVAMFMRTTLTYSLFAFFMTWTIPKSLKERWSALLNEQGQSESPLWPRATDWVLPRAF